GHQGHLGCGGPVHLRAAGRCAARAGRRGALRVWRGAAVRLTPPHQPRGRLRPAGGQGRIRPAGSTMNVATLRRIAFAVFRESIRDRVPYGLVGFALLVMGASYLIGQVTAGQDVKIIKDLGLAAMSIFGLFIAVFIGIGLVSKELERRRIYSLIAEPVRRAELIVGKYPGLVFTIVVNVAVMTAVWYLVLGYMSWMETEAFKQSWEAPATDPRMLVAVYLIVIQLMLVIAIALLDRKSTRLNSSP